MTTKGCKQCDKRLQGRQRKFCSFDCRQTSDIQKRTQTSRSRKNHTCQTCGKPMTEMKWRRKHCSNTCNNRNKTNLTWIRNLTKLYGLSLLEYETKLISQDNRCAVCRQLETVVRNGRVQRLAVDHCHESDQVRGLLCMRCNLTIGQIGDQWLILDNAMEYLSYWNDKLKTSNRQRTQETPSLH